MTGGEKREREKTEIEKKENDKKEKEERKSEYEVVAIKSREGEKSRRRMQYRNKNPQIFLDTAGIG